MTGNGMLLDLKSFEVWFLTGSQHLYGEETLRQVDSHAKQIADALDQSPNMAVRVRHKPVLTTASSMQEQIEAANADERCIGLVLWMHTFSPAQMWIAALQRLRKPFLHLHTQFNRDLPWSSIDMDFMNLNQSAHGDREFGFMASRLRLRRTIVVGYFEDKHVQQQIGRWARVAAAWSDSQRLKIARFGDNMRNVAVTEGDKVEAQVRFGYSVNGYGVGDLVEQIDAVEGSALSELLDQYEESYSIADTLRKGGAQRSALEDAARIELGLRRFLVQGGFGAWTDTFEDLHGLRQLPGIAAQRLMADGYGFGPEGDWKTAALVHSMKVMSAGLPGGTSLMEDYTYHLADGGQVLGSHMLEICPSIASGKPRVEIHPLSIGGKSDPVRLVFDTRSGPAVVASVVDLGDRFRMIINKVNVIDPPQPLPKLPVARALWRTEPSFEIAATSWLLAGGAHHTGFSQALTDTDLKIFADMAGIESLVIDENTSVRNFENELRWNDAAYRLSRF